MTCPFSQCNSLSFVRVSAVHWLQRKTSDDSPDNWLFSFSLLGLFYPFFFSFFFFLSYLYPFVSSPPWCEIFSNDLDHSIERNSRRKTMRGPFRHFLYWRNFASLRQMSFSGKIKVLWNRIASQLRRLRLFSRLNSKEENISILKKANPHGFFILYIVFIYMYMVFFFFVLTVRLLLSLTAALMRPSGCFFEFRRYYGGLALSNRCRKRNNDK